MKNIVRQVQSQSQSARAQVEALLRTPFDQQQVQGLRESNARPKDVETIYPLIAANYPPRLRALLDEPKPAVWLQRELAKLDPTAYCLYLPPALYERIRPALPALPAKRPEPAAELAYLAAFINRLAAEDLEPYTPAAHGREESTAEEIKRWQSLLHQVCQIEKAARVIRTQLTPAGRLAHRFSSIAR